MFQTKRFPLCLQISAQPLFVPGVWGPCLSAMVPGMWLNEGGQSATGRLVCVLKIKLHAALDEKANQSTPDVSDLSPLVNLDWLQCDWKWKSKELTRLD